MIGLSDLAATMANYEKSSRPHSRECRLLMSERGQSDNFAGKDGLKTGLDFEIESAMRSTLMLLP